MPRLSLRLPEELPGGKPRSEGGDGPERLGSRPLMERWVGCWADSTDG